MRRTGYESRSGRARAASGNALDNAPDRLNELHRRAAAVLTHLEAGITCPKDALLFVDERRVDLHLMKRMKKVAYAEQ